MNTAIQKGDSLLTLRGTKFAAGVDGLPRETAPMQCVADALSALGVHPYMVHSEAVYFTTGDQRVAYQIHCAVMEANKEAMHWTLAAFFPRYSPQMPTEWHAGDLGYCVNPAPATLEMSQSDLLVAAQALAQHLLRIAQADWTTPFAATLGFATVT